jgi:SAM-dependent methyltransferase
MQTTKTMISREDVIWCYKHLLGREVESNEVIDAHLAAGTLKQLVEIFVGSQEFIMRCNGQNPIGFVGASSLPPVMEKLDVEVVADAKDLGKCAAKIKTAWEYMGEETAHYSVLSNDIFLPDNLHDSIDSFWASGEPEASQAIRALNQYSASGLSEKEKVCVEYGCGVGRVTVNFAKHFKTVHAYDISRNHLKLARARAHEQAVSNIAFHECSKDFRVAIEPCDFFYSVIVLQHNPPPVILELIRLALNALNPGGVAMFQVPTYIIGYNFDLKEWLKTDHDLNMQMHCVPQDTVIDIIADAGCRLLGLREDGWTGARDRIISNTFFCRKK